MNFSTIKSLDLTVLLFYFESLSLSQPPEATLLSNLILSFMSLSTYRIFNGSFSPEPQNMIWVTIFCSHILDV